MSCEAIYDGLKQLFSSHLERAETVFSHLSHSQNEDQIYIAELNHLEKEGKTIATLIHSAEKIIKIGELDTIKAANDNQKSKAEEKQEFERNKENLNALLERIKNNIDKQKNDELVSKHKNALRKSKKSSQI